MKQGGQQFIEFRDDYKENVGDLNSDAANRIGNDKLYHE